LDHPFDFVGIAAYLSKETTEQAAGSSQRTGRHTSGRGLELGHKAISAAVAEKLELITFVGGMVRVITSELNQGHGVALPSIVFPSRTMNSSAGA
jgi:hypothetical protein